MLSIKELTAHNLSFEMQLIVGVFCAVNYNQVHPLVKSLILKLHRFHLILHHSYDFRPVIIIKGLLF